jgi:ribonuclease D
VTITSEKARYVYLFDLYVRPELMGAGLKSLLEDARIVKILHDCRGDVRALAGQFDVRCMCMYRCVCTWCHDITRLQGRCRVV